MPTCPKSADIVIVGGGVIGLAIAYHLAKLGADDVILVERHRLTSGSSWHAAGIIGPLRASMNLTKLSVYATELFVAIEQETGQATGYRRTGGLWLAQTRDRMTELSRTAAMGEIAGLDAHMIGPVEVADRFPHLETGDLQGALWVEEDGQADPVDVCMAYAKGARMGGVRIFENAPVRRVRSVSGAVHSVELETGEAIRCRAAVNCAGAWAAAARNLSLRARRPPRRADRAHGPGARRTCRSPPRKKRWCWPRSSRRRPGSRASGRWSPRCSSTGSKRACACSPTPRWSTA